MLDVIHEVANIPRSVLTHMQDSAREEIVKIAIAAKNRAPINEALAAFALDVLSERGDDGEEHAMDGQLVAWAERRGLVVAAEYTPELTAMLRLHQTTPRGPHA
jgi:hypothetical protein